MGFIHDFSVPPWTSEKRESGEQSIRVFVIPLITVGRSTEEDLDRAARDRREHERRLFEEGHAAIKTEDTFVETEACVDIRNDQVWRKFRAG